MKYTNKKEVTKSGNSKTVFMSEALSVAGLELGDEVQVSVTDENVITIEKVKKKR